MNGTVKWFHRSRGYGFITGEDGADIYAHYTDIVKDGFKTLKANQKVTYDVTTDDKGRTRAVNIKEVTE